MIPKETRAKRRRRKIVKTTTWVAGIVSIGAALAPHVADIVRVILKR